MKAHACLCANPRLIVDRFSRLPVMSLPRSDCCNPVSGRSNRIRAPTVSGPHLCQGSSSVSAPHAFHCSTPRGVQYIATLTHLYSDCKSRTISVQKSDSPKTPIAMLSGSEHTIQVRELTKGPLPSGGRHRRSRDARSSVFIYAHRNWSTLEPSTAPIMYSRMQMG